MKKKSKDNTYFCVMVSWRPSQKYDYFGGRERLEKFVSRETAGSGCGMGSADADWCYKQKATAIKIAKRLKRLKWLSSVDITKYSDTEDVNIEF